MRIQDKLSIKTYIVSAFLVVAVSLIGFGMYSLYEMKSLGDLTRTLYEHPLRVSNAALAAQGDIARMHRITQEIPRAHSQFTLLDIVRRLEKDEAEVYRQFDIIQKHILGDEGKKLVNETRQNFAAWKALRLKTEALKHEGNAIAAARLNEEQGAPHVKNLEQRMEDLKVYALNKADQFMAEADKAQERIVHETLISLAGLCLLLFIVAYIVTDHLTHRIKKLQTLMTHITESGKLAEVEVFGDTETSRLARCFNTLIRSLKRQFWLREGVNTLNDSIAQHASFPMMLETAISHIARHMEAGAAVVFTHDEGSRSNEMKASYAMAEGDHFAHRFADGVGIIGQVAHEKKAIHLKDIPQNDGLMQSGTMHTVPREILAIPLVHRTRLLGVIEVASLKELDVIAIEFLERAAEIVATAMNTMHQREQIDTMYQESRDANMLLAGQNEELQAQSEELKAQTIELKCQADELSQQKNELEAKRIQVEEADRLKSEFLSNMSHELRTPLNSILVLSQLMQTQGTGHNTDKEAEYLQIIERNGRSLLSLINDVLDLSKIESGRMDLFVTKFFPVDLVEEVVETIRPLASKKGVTLSFLSDYTQTMSSDRDKVSQIILNILSNAVKFTENGEITINLTEEAGNLVFSIRDSGIGIEKENLEFIFDAFRQVDGSTTRRHEGTGLGLSICKKLATLLGGDVSVESQPGQGSTFVFRTPIHMKMNGLATTKDATIPPAHAETRERTILVVDDDAETRKVIRTHLTQAGYNVVEAGDGKEALRLANSLSLFAVVLDVVMPEMDGWEVIRQLKMSTTTMRVPVILVSANDDHATGKALGANGYIVKPLDRERLLREIRLIQISNMVNTVLVVDDDEATRNQVTSFLKEAGYETIEATNGKTGLEQAKSLFPDVVVLDLIMPEMDGFQFLEAMSREPLLKKQPVIILTSKDLSADEKTLLYGRAHTIFQKGTMDTQTMLLKLDHELKTITVDSLQSADALNMPTVLVVEDNEIAAMQISTTLEEIHCTVHHSVDGDEAIAFVETTIPDIIILDLMMPGVDGFEVLESIRSKPETALIPVIVLTAKELTSKDRARLSNNNVRQLIRKGTLDRNQLRDVVLQAVGRKQAVAGDSTKSKSLGSSAHSVTDRRQTEPGKTILIVEDNKDNQLAIKASLEDLGYQLVIAEDGESGVKMAKALQPSLVLMDIQLPGMNGLDATKAIKRDATLASIPVIALTARAMKNETQEINDAGFDDLLTKPYDPETLRDIVLKWMKEKDR